MWQTTSKNCTKVRAARAARLFFRISQSDHCFLALSLPLPSSVLKFPNIVGKVRGANVEWQIWLTRENLEMTRLQSGWPSREYTASRRFGPQKSTRKVMPGNFGPLPCPFRSKLNKQTHKFYHSKETLSTIRQSRPWQWQINSRDGTSRLLRNRFRHAAVSPDSCPARSLLDPSRPALERWG